MALHQWRVLIRHAANTELAFFFDAQEGPSAAEARGSGLLKLILERVKVAKGGFYRIANGAWTVRHRHWGP